MFLKIGDLQLSGNVFLAPMAGITDSAFRKICKRYGASMVFSEMISAKALYYNDKKTVALMNIDKDEHPCGVQIFGSEPDIMAWAAKKAISTGARVLDINMGCPVSKIVGNNEGCALMKKPDLVERIVYNVANSVDIPVTVKIRKGFDESSINAVEIAKIAEKNGAKAITIHGRTKSQMYGGNADWDIIGEVKASVNIPVIGNGDIFSAADAINMLKYTGCDGIMVARGAQGNPFIFKQIEQLLGGNTIDEFDKSERIGILLEQIRIMIEKKGEYIAIREARKHASWYTKGMKNAAKARQEINTVNSYIELKNVLQSIL